MKYSVLFHSHSEQIEQHFHWEFYDFENYHLENVTNEMGQYKSLIHTLYHFFMPPEGWPIKSPT